jgi:hypothetical protein
LAKPLHVQSIQDPDESSNSFSKRE